MILYLNIPWPTVTTCRPLADHLPITCRPLADHLQSTWWMNVDKCGWKWMEVDKSGWKWTKWMKMNESGWNRMKVNENVWSLCDHLLFLLTIWWVLGDYLVTTWWPFDVYLLTIWWPFCDDLVTTSSVLPPFFISSSRWSFGDSFGTFVQFCVFFCTSKHLFN